MRERLIELLQNFSYGAYTSNGIIVDGTKVDDITDYLLANGVIVPPCKVGDTVYLPTRNGIEEHRIERIEIHGNDRITFCYAWHGCGYEHKNASDFGKTVFLTKEEAERALKGGEQE